MVLLWISCILLDNGLFISLEMTYRRAHLKLEFTINGFMQLIEYLVFPLIMSPDVILLALTLMGINILFILFEY